MRNTKLTREQQVAEMLNTGMDSRDHDALVFAQKQELDYNHRGVFAGGPVMHDSANVFFQNTVDPRDTTAVDFTGAD